MREFTYFQYSCCVHLILDKLYTPHIVYVFHCLCFPLANYNDGVDTVKVWYFLNIL